MRQGKVRRNKYGISTLSADQGGHAMPNAFILIVLLVVVCAAWLVWTERKSKQALDKDALDQAWREVLDDPHYIERRHYEERMRVEEEARTAAAKHAVRAEPNP
jgi:hypothetical protein